MAENKKSEKILKPLQVIILVAVIIGTVLLLVLKSILPNTSIKTYAVTIAFLSFLLSLFGYLAYNRIVKSKNRRTNNNDI